MTAALSPTTAPATERLPALRRGETAVVTRVEHRPGGSDAVATRLEDLGFVPGEGLRVIGIGPIGGDPIVVQVGYTRFALRRSEAARIVVSRAATAANAG